MDRDSFYNVLYKLINIPFYVLDENKESSLFSGLSIPDKLNEVIKKNRIQVIRSIEADTVSRLKDVSNLSYIGFMIQEDTVVIGPFLEQETDLNNLTALKKRLRLIREDAVMLDSMFNQLRVLESVEIHFIFHLIKRMFGTGLDPLQFKLLTPERVKNAQRIDVDSLFQEFEFVKRNYEIEDMFMSIIETGDVTKARNFQTHEIMSNLPERAINDTLRNTKTRLTIMNTLCNRAAIRGGVDVQLGHQISTNFGIQIESMKSNFDANKFMRDILLTYTEAVDQYAIRDYSKLIRNAIFYIRRHITGSVSLHDIADYLYISKEHLSRQFKHETGYTVTRYINRTKVIEAKKLLKQQTHSVLDIATILGFANSSHFSKVFKDYEGITPKQYQNSAQ
ncbi:helix-turn-helix domain-containing protein [Candidatus Xianfuyuplasma coldseepsis]|uniref:Helix-turn-helix domain-containing protein n=1 Tax=Candidatus Xianfuyuplasma coldseepsis TaxID=2782163 RepID=A0A7L7KQX0_9MOLU|nr:helix-turn-helix domain-containing protein [Xianfuyuplasma coldseepsis]QMS85077.1 helix-turn-helix domain-containing protein [Xianfuyuplasma coldseepsis]